METTLKFKDLSLGETFEFDHSKLSVACYQFAHGPFVKTGTRKYTDGRYEHRVGTINTTVLRGTSCGHPHRAAVERIAAAMFPAGESK